MKILRIIARLNIGGPARNAVLLTEALGSGVKPRTTSFARLRGMGQGSRVDRDWETVFVCGEVAETEGDMMYFAREKGISPIIIKELGRELSWKDDWRAFWKIYNIICREKPDIIHTHTAKAGALGRMAGIIYRWRVEGRGCKLAHTFHGHVFSGYFGKGKTLFFIWIEKFLALFTDKIITVSVSLKKELVEKFKIAPESKISVIELGFELEELFKLPVRGNSEVISIGIVGRLVPVKNHKMLFKVAKRVKGEGLRVNIVVVGDGEMREELERYAEELGIIDSVEFKGWVEDLKTIYEGLDIVVLTSLNEGTPVSLIEAMASGRPVVAAKVGGVPDIVQDDQDGYLVEPQDVEGFSRKLLDLINDPEKRRKFGESGRNIVKSRFSKERLIKDTERLYNKLLK